MFISIYFSEQINSFKNDSCVLRLFRSGIDLVDCGLDLLWACSYTESVYSQSRNERSCQQMAPDWMLKTPLRSAGTPDLWSWTAKERKRRRRRKRHLAGKSRLCPIERNLMQKHQRGFRQARWESTPAASSEGATNRAPQHRIGTISAQRCGSADSHWDLLWNTLKHIS